MKAHEVLKRYADGRRDFSGENLRGQSFKGKNLSGANFSEANIQGANFTNAVLTDTNFSSAKAGIKRRWAMSLVIASWILSTLSGIFAINVVFIFDQNIIGIIGGWVALIMLAVFFIVTIRNGLIASLETFFVAVAIAVAGVIAGFGAEAVVFIGAIAVAVAGAGVVAGVGAGIVAGAGAGTGILAVAVAVFATGIAITFFVYTFVAVAKAVVFIGAVAVVLLGAYISWRALQGDDRDAWIRIFAIAFVATGGTSFRHADLTDADFTRATLKSTDFRNAILTRTNLHRTKKLDRARVGNTILINAKVRDLLVTHQGAKQSYIGCNLKGANLAGADLKDADLTEADISGAKLQQACLERANLTKTQALNTNFNQAYLTGACLEAWNINSVTQLNGAICDYVYLLNNHKERRPKSGKFAPGEFTKLFQEVLNTIDLIISNGISTVAETINQLPASSEPGKPGLKELLVQLQAAINDPNLDENDKTQALEQIKVLAEAGQNPKNETTQKQAKKAVGFLKVIAEGLPSAATLVKTCQDLLPAIALYFGL